MAKVVGGILVDLVARTAKFDKKINKSRKRKMKLTAAELIKQCNFHKSKLTQLLKIVWNAQRQKLLPI